MTCKHDWLPLGPCDHPASLGRLGYAFECRSCGAREHRWTMDIGIRRPPPYEWLLPTTSEEDRARAIAEEKARCLVE